MAKKQRRAGAIQGTRHGSVAQPAADKRRVSDAGPLKRAAVLYRTGRLHEAKRICEKVVETSPGYFMALSLRGAIAGRLGDMDHAADCFCRAVVARPDDAGAHVNLGIALRSCGRLDEAAASYRHAIDLQPDFAAAHNNLGNVLRDLGELDTAIAAYRRAVEIDGTYAEAHNNLGIALTGIHRLDEAVASFRRAIAINPGFARAYNNLGHALARKEQGADAISCWQRALELDPDLAEAHTNLGRTYRRQGDLEAAIACYRRAAGIDPQRASVHRNLGDALRDQGNLNEAANSIGRALELDANDADNHYSIGRLYAVRGKPDEAIASLRRTIEIKPDHAAAHNDLGNLLRARGELGEAAASFERALAIRPNFAEACNNLGIVRKHQDRIDEAIACYRRCVEMDPDNAEAHNNLANAFKDQNRPDEALASYRRAITIRPDLVEAHCNLAKVHAFRPGDPEIEALKDLLERDGISRENRTHLRLALGKAHDEIGRYDEAFAYYQEANAEIAKEMPFDAGRHRRAVREIKNLFREPGPPCWSPPQTLPVPVFVLGVSRSGKSLVESLLAQHEGVFAGGEGHLWSDAVAAIMERVGTARPFPVGVSSLNERDIADMGRTYLKEVAERAPRCRLFVNTMPSNYPFVGLICRALPTARVVHAHRHPLDVCLASYFYRYKTGNAYSYDLRSVGSYCADYHEIMAHWRRLYGTRIAAVRYEDLVQHPDTAVPSLFAYCGLEYDPETIHADLTTGEVGRWKNYDAYLGPLREALAGSPLVNDIGRIEPA